MKVEAATDYSEWLMFVGEPLWLGVFQLRLFLVLREATALKMLQIANTGRLNKYLEDLHFFKISYVYPGV